MSINPYQPPETTSVNEPAALIWDAGDAGPIRFSGKPTDEDLNLFISTHDSVGCVGLGLCAWVAIFAFGWLLVSDLTSVTSIVIGIAVIATVTGLVSSRFYRRMSFIAMNPDWQTEVSGEVRADGVLIQREHSRLFVRWDCLIDIVAGPSIVGLYVMPHVGESVVIGEAMLEKPVSEQRVNEFVRQIRRQLTVRGSMDARRRFLDVLLREQRERSVPIPNGAIAFSGPVFRRELIIARKASKKKAVGKVEKWLCHSRPFAIVASLVLGFVLIFGGVLHAVLPHDPLLAHTLTYGMLAIGWFTYRRRSKRVDKDAIIQHLNAFANEDGITSDGNVIVTSLPWSHIQLVSSKQDRLVLRHTKTRRVMVVRSDMFQGETDWGQFVALATGS